MIASWISSRVGLVSWALVLSGGEELGYATVAMGKID